MTYGVGRANVKDEKTALEYGWVEGDATCFWLNAEVQRALQSTRKELYVKGCEHAGIALEDGRNYMEVACPVNCRYRR
jgi:hypothetical protein